MNEKPKPFIRLALSLLLAACAAACQGTAAEPPLKGATIGGPFTLTDQNGRTVRDTDFTGKYRIVYFGYTHCPDICPNDLGVIGRAMRAFERKAPARAAQVQPIFITVDPERDTPAVMKEYAAAFHPRLLGLTGTPQQVAAAVKEFRLYVGKQKPEADGSYAVDHSRMSVLLGRKGEPIVLLPSDQGSEAVLSELDTWVR